MTKCSIGPIPFYLQLQDNGYYEKKIIGLLSILLGKVPVRIFWIYGNTLSCFYLFINKYNYINIINLIINTIVFIYYIHFMEENSTFYIIKVHVNAWKKLLGLIKYILMSNRKVLVGIFQSVRLHHYASRCHNFFTFFIMMLWVNETICSKRLIEERINLRVLRRVEDTGQSTISVSGKKDKVAVTFL